MRFIDLLIIFLPCLCLLPLLYFKRTGDYWRECFVKAVERAGVVWIKVFQYLSHRGDIIGPELAKKVERLREHAPMHSFEETAKIIKENYGKNYD